MEGFAIYLLQPLDSNRYPAINMHKLDGAPNPGTAETKMPRHPKGQSIFHT